MRRLWSPVVRLKRNQQPTPREKYATFLHGIFCLREKRSHNLVLDNAFLMRIVGT